MKILILNTYDLRGGAARAAYRLHQSLLKASIDSHMLVQSKNSNDYTVLGPSNKFQKYVNKMRPALDALPIRLYPNKTKTLFSSALLPFAHPKDIISILNPDIVHLHWVTDGMIRIEDLSKIKKPIVWSMHDMWPFTGGCHYDEGCGKYKTICEKCPVLGSEKIIDLSNKVFKRKQRAYRKIDNLTLIGLSNWIADCAKQSSLFYDRNIVKLPNPIDTDRFFPIPKNVARKILNLPIDKKLLLFGSNAAANDPRKGYEKLLKSLTFFDQNDDIQLLVFGNKNPKNCFETSLTVHYLGHLNDDISLQILYSAADVMVAPSLQENLSNIIMEALACGTPVVAFDVGGNKDLIEHKQNGYLVEPFSVEKLAHGIKWIINSSDYVVLSQNSREKVLRSFDSKSITAKYVALYKNILV